jgi:integrase
MAKRKRYPGSITRRGDTHLVRLCVGGVVSRFTAKTRDRRAAESFAVQKYEELLRHQERRAEGLPDVVRFSDLLTEFEGLLAEKCAGTQRSYGDSLKPIREFFVLGKLSDPQVDKVRTVHIEQYLDWRRTHRLQGRRKTDGGTLHARTLNKDRAVLHRLFTEAEKREYRQGNPVQHAERRKADKYEPVILTGEQYQALVDQSADKPTLALYVLLLGETGMRCESEALHLRWEDVSLDNTPEALHGFIRVVSGRDGHRTKSGKSRQVPMTPRLAAAMREYFATYRFARFVSESPYIFTHSATLRNHAQGKRIGSLRNAVRTTVRKAKLPDNFRQHDLRHRRVTTWLAEGQSPVHVQKAMGHSDIKTTMGYYQYLPEHLSALVANSPTSSSARAAV